MTAVVSTSPTFVDADELEVLREGVPEERLEAWDAWIGDLPSTTGPDDELLIVLPADGALWPCTICEAGRGEPCGGSLEDRDFFHVGRGFQIAITQPGARLGDDELEDLVDGCVPTVESATCPAYRGRCLGCGHRTRIVSSENEAVELIHDHTDPGWRDLPVVPPWPRGTNATPKRTEKQRAEWMAEHGDLFPAGWLDGGGPVVVARRDGDGTRHVPGYAPTGGYEIDARSVCGEGDDVAVVESPSTALEPIDQADELEAPAGDDLWSSMEHWLFHEDGDLTLQQAAAVTAKARAYSAELYRILGRAHERRIWAAMGHESWTAYVAEEFDIGRSRAYQLVAQYEANEALSATAEFHAGSEVDEMSEAQARPLGTLRTDPAAVRQIWERAKQMSDGLPPTMATMADAVAWYRGQLSITDDTPPPTVGVVEPEADELDPVVPVEPSEDDWEDVPDETPAQREITRAHDRFETALSQYREDPGKDTERVALACRRVAARAVAGVAPDPVWAARCVRKIQDAFYAELDENGPVDTQKNGSEDLRRFDGFRADLLVAIDPNDLLPKALRKAVEQRDAVSFNRREGKAKHDVRFPRLMVEDLLDVWDPPALAGDDDEVLRGELVDRDTDAPDEPAAPPAAGSPDRGGEDSSGAESSPSPSKRIRPVDVAALVDDRGVDGTVEVVRIAVDVGLRSKRPEDLDEAAQWLRATASYMESRRVDLERHPPLRSV